MQRVRIGLTGLACCFLLVLLAAIFTRASDEKLITADGIDQQQRAADSPAADEAEPKEPLAELGVAPGSTEGNGAAPAAQ